MSSEIQLLEDSFDKSFLRTNFEDTTISFGESIVDNFLEDGIIKEIPIVKTLYSIGKTILGIRQKSYIRKVVKLLYETESIPIKDRKKFLDSLDNDTNKQATEILLQTIDNFDSDEKIEILSNLIKAKIRDEISNEIFLRLSKITQFIFYADLNKLFRYQNLGHPYEDYSTESLLSVGLICQTANDWKDIDSMINVGGFNHKSKFVLTRLGRSMLHFGLK